MKRVKTAVLILCLMSSGFNICADELLDLRSVLDSQKGNQLINVPKGNYVLDLQNGKNAYVFSNLSGVTIEGNGSTIICNRQNQAFQFTSCQNVNFRNFIIDYDPPCTSQGTIVELSNDKKTLTVELHKGYPLEGITLSSKMLMYGKDRELIKNFQDVSSTTYEVLQREPVAKIKFTLDVNLSPDRIPEGKGQVNPSQNLVDLYEMKTTGEKFDWTNPMHAQNPYYNRDPRLDYTVFRNESQFNNKGVLEIYEGGANGKGVPNATGTGYYIRKFTDETLDLVQNRTSVHTWVFFRLAEMYLNYAEALNECEPGNPDILIYANKTRERVGVEMPPITETDQAAVRERIRNERSVELAFEGHRLWDVRRWMTAMDVLNQPLRGVSCTYEDYEYKYSVIEVEKRVFKPEMYFYPIPQSLLYTTGNKWVQNPGWGI